MKSPPVIVNLPISLFSSVFFFFMSFEAPLLGAYISRIVESPWRNHRCITRVIASWSCFLF